ncbi:hypothetical protein Z945_1711 [Sulfitobacter noctilucae]|uniref:hypothetical protein n=1 Tax=Sulfitobacter noctilucae TaxID=1342302 RepID=UPI00046A609E|nr:hypothetical protein [Sulfitobacter noctilucae]KIN60732.1 hypothetical protein Z945_1711 [Sulfitobacter noctilucae]
MTATSDFMTNPALTALPIRMADGGRMIIRGSQRLLGAALILSAFGLWLAPGAAWESDVMLFKLILSVTAVIAGVAMMQTSATPPPPEIEIDTIRREVRLVRYVRGQSPVVLQSSGFATLAQVEHDGTNIRLWDAAGVFLAEVNLSDRAARNSLLAGLRDAGKLD